MALTPDWRVFRVGVTVTPLVSCSQCQGWITARYVSATFGGGPLCVACYDNIVERHMINETLRRVLDRMMVSDWIRF